MGHVRQLVVFVSVGALSTATYLVVLAVLSAAPDHGLPLVHALSYAVAMVVSFVGHRTFTFKRAGSSRERRIEAEVPKFVACHAISLVLSTACVALVQYVTTSKWIAIGCAGLVAIGTSYVLMQYWVFPGDGKTP